MQSIQIVEGLVISVSVYTRGTASGACDGRGEMTRNDATFLVRYACPLVSSPVLLHGSVRVLITLSIASPAITYHKLLSIVTGVEL